MKDGRITQAGKYNDILNSGTDFMELVGEHEKALLALDSVEAGSVSESTNMSKEVGNMSSTNGVAQRQENTDVETCKTDDTVGTKDRLSKKKREKKVKLGFQSTGSISPRHTEEFLCPLYCWHKFFFSSFKLEVIIGWPLLPLSQKT